MPRSSDKKGHADFQSKYNSSINFNTTKKDEILKPTDNREVKLSKERVLTENE
ncbi:MAG: hypothetical protein ACI836_001255 [Saprospiraceae bacterium]